MKLLWSDNVRWYALVAALVAALGLLAALQYRSVREVSITMTEQMRANLRGSLMDVRQGLERELRPLCRELLIRSGLSLENDLRQVSAHFENWRSTTTHPSLVKEVYVWEPSPNGHADLFRLASNGTFAPMSWPEDLTGLKIRLNEMSGLPERRNSEDTASSPVSAHLSGSEGLAARTQPHPSHLWMIDQDIPALVRPTYQQARDGDEEAGINSCIIVVLDRNVLSGHILPELIQRYFGTNNQSQYQVAVVDKNQQALDLFDSDSRPIGKSGVLDAGVNLFGRPTLLVASRGPAWGGTFVPFASNSPNRPDYFSAPPNSPPENQDEGPPSLIIDPIHYPRGQEWEIVAKHRLGSVDAAVAVLSRRNLTFNLGIVAVLAATMAMIIATSMRARRFGQLQMDFVANVSHELRTPLTGIISSAQNIADGLIENKEKAAAYGNAIIREAQQLSELVEQILQFSAMQKNGDQYRRQRVDVAEIVSLALKNTSVLIHSADVTVEQTIEPGLPLISADSKAVARCLQNLIGNAVKYGGERRWIGVRAGKASSSDGRQEIYVSVADNGLGIRPQDLNRIFEPFYRASEVSEAQIHGTGLGLPLAKKVAEAMGGTITVASEFGKGSTFTLHMPLQ
jgi:signal transduction histidine kinase